MLKNLYWWVMVPVVFAFILMILIANIFPNLKPAIVPYLRICAWIAVPIWLVTMIADFIKIFLK